jgi:hypothetical protein
MNKVGVTLTPSAYTPMKLRAEGAPVKDFLTQKQGKRRREYKYDVKKVGQQAPEAIE